MAVSLQNKIISGAPVAPGAKKGGVVTELVDRARGDVLIRKFLLVPNAKLRRSKFAALARRIQSGAIALEQATMKKLNPILRKLDIPVPTFGDKRA